MKDYESTIKERLRDQLIQENKKLAEERFNRKPLRERVLNYAFGITFVLSGLFIAGYIAYRIFVILTPIFTLR